MRPAVGCGPGRTVAVRCGPRHSLDGPPVVSTRLGRHAPPKRRRRCPRSPRAGRHSRTTTRPAVPSPSSPDVRRAPAPRPEGARASESAGGRNRRRARGRLRRRRRRRGPRGPGCRPGRGRVSRLGPGWLAGWPWVPPLAVGPHLSANRTVHIFLPSRPLECAPTPISQRRSRMLCRWPDESMKWRGSRPWRRRRGTCSSRCFAGQHVAVALPDRGA